MHRLSRRARIGSLLSLLVALIAVGYALDQARSQAHARVELEEERSEISIPATIEKLPQRGAGAGERVTFAVMGDIRDGEEIFQEQIHDAKRRGADFAIVLGDLIPSGRADCYYHFAEKLEQLPLPVLVLPGNHDYSHGGRAIYHRLFGPTDYSFDLAGYRFIMLDNAEGRLSAGQLGWLEQKLHSASPALVFMHMPPNTVPQWSWHAFSGGATRFMGLMDRYRPRRVFMSHIHAYDQFMHHGVQYVVTGGGGAELASELGPKAAFHHYLLVETAPDGLKTTVAHTPSR